MKLRLASACFIAAFLVSAVALGQEDPEQKRTQLFKEGRALSDAGKWSEAADRFRAVVAIRSAPKALIALAIAEERLHHLVEAKQLYEKARLDARLQQLKDDENTAVEALKQLAPRVPGVALRLPSDVRGVSVTVDGKPVDLEGGEIDMEAGEHTIVVSAPGRADFQTTVTAEEGKRGELDVALPSSTGTPPKEKPVEGSGSGIAPPPMGAMVLGGAGIVTGITGVILLGVGKSAERDAMKACGGYSNCPVSLKPDVESSARKIIAGDVLLGLGAAAVVGGGAWWFLAGGKGSGAKGVEAPPADARLFVAPLSGGAFMSLEGAF